jgi:hypothetical protein
VEVEGGGFESLSLRSSWDFSTVWRIFSLIMAEISFLEGCNKFVCILIPGG